MYAGKRAYRNFYSQSSPDAGAHADSNPDAGTHTDANPDAGAHDDAHPHLCPDSHSYWCTDTHANINSRSTMPDALTIVRAAEDNLRGLSSFSIEYMVDGGGVRYRREANINPPDRGMMVEHDWGSYHPRSIELLYVDAASYFRPFGFRAWFESVGGSGNTWVQAFPFDLSGLRDGVEEIVWQGTDDVDGRVTHRLTAAPTQRLEAMLGFRDGVDWWKDGALEVELWVSRDDQLPLRMEFRSDEHVLFSAVWSAFDVAVEIHPPKEALDVDYFDRLWYGGLREEDVALLVPLFPDEGKECVKDQIGADLYEEALSGGDANLAVGMAINLCVYEVFSATRSFVYPGIDNTLYALDLSVLSVSPEDMVEGVVECLRELIGLESLLEIGFEERAPAPEEMESAEMCKVFGTAQVGQTALVALYHATDGPNWANNSNWLSDRPLGEWYGVSTDGNGRVTLLDLRENGLSGSIPVELGNLSYLQILDVRFNSTLSGSLPGSLTGLTSLVTLSLDGTGLCAPTDDRFQTWLQRVENKTGVVKCEGPDRVEPAATPTGSGKPTITLADNQYESLWISNAIFSFIAENGYGYPVEIMQMTTPIAQVSLANGEVDIWIELWIANIIGWYNEEIANGTIEDLLNPPILEGGPQFFMVPQWVADQYNIRTIDDMKRPEVVSLFLDPEDTSKGIFINCPIGWQCAHINRAKLQAYGLSDLYNIQSGGTFAALDAALAGAQLRNEPVFGYYWAPTALMGKYEWTVIEEPAYNAACWGEVIKGRDDASYTPNEACAYEEYPVGKGISSGLREKAPEIVSMLEKMNIGVDAMNKTAAWASDNDIQGNWEKAAIYFLETYEDRWTSWMPQENADKVKEALAE